jgi:tight adherence protein C
MVLLAAVCAFGAISFLVYGLMGRSRAPETDRRLASLAGDRPRQVVPAEDLGPTRGQALAGMLGQFLPRTLLAKLGHMLLTADVKAAPEVVLTGWAALVLFLPGFYLLIALRSGPLGGMQEAFVGVLLLLSAYAPFVLIRGRVSKRRKRMLKALPDMMDLLTTCVEAGLGIDAALAKVSEKAKEPLAGEIRLILRTMAMGRPRREALEQFSDRAGLTEIVSLTGAIIQAERMGVSLGHVLRVQSDALRVQRKQRAEQQAFKAPVKIIVVLAFFIFPSMFIVIIGPAALPFIGGK